MRVPQGGPTSSSSSSSLTSRYSAGLLSSLASGRYSSAGGFRLEATLSAIMASERRRGQTEAIVA